MPELTTLQFAMLGMGAIGALATLGLGYRALRPPERRAQDRRSADRRRFARGGTERRQLGRRKKP
jgi:hypothetical protein